MSFYDNFKMACDKRGTSISNVLVALGRSTGSTGNWRNGQYPGLNIVMDIAKYLNMSIDELVYGVPSDSAHLSQAQTELLRIFESIPDDKKDICIDFLRTHMADTKYSLRQEA